MFQVVTCFDPDEEMVIELLQVVDRGSSGQADKGINGKQESFFFVRLNHENGQPGEEGQVEQPGRDVYRAGSFWKTDDSVSEKCDWPDQEPG